MSTIQHRAKATVTSETTICEKEEEIGTLGCMYHVQHGWQQQQQQQQQQH